MESTHFFPVEYAVARSDGPHGVMLVEAKIAALSAGAVNCCKRFNPYSPLGQVAALAGDASVKTSINAINAKSRQARTDDLTFDESKQFPLWKISLYLEYLISMQIRK
ncbi:hypothetical protein [Sphingobium baderi]|uniref:hypothetical protein n=1 Tax=Sphingobium baderi TaxID=1332080 RepID=UPI002B40B4DD|nr:hypothetical protein [Sphingobium baderi]WRD75287.1 hypothetical protein QQ987_10800 [Sphingobium baderi]